MISTHQALTENTKCSWALCGPGGTSCDLTNEEALIGGLNRGDDQGEILCDRDAASQRGPVVTFPFPVIRTESNALSGSLLVLNGQRRMRNNRSCRRKKDKKQSFSYRN